MLLEKKKKEVTIHGRASVDRLARGYLHQLSADTGDSLEDLVRPMNNRVG